MRCAGERRGETAREYDRLAGMEPALKGLESRVKALAATARGRPKWCANAAWYGHGDHYGNGIRGEVVRLVGWERNPPGYEAPPRVEPKVEPGGFIWVSELAVGYEKVKAARKAALEKLDPAARERERELSTSRAYSTVYAHLYEMLPNCRRCGCL